MKNYEIVGDKWRNKGNGEQFHTFVLLDTEILPKETGSLAAEFAKNGGRIFSCGSDVQIQEAVNFENLREMARACKEVTDMGIQILEGTDRCQRNLPAYPDHLIDPYIHNGENLYGVGISRYDKDGYRIYNFTNYDLREENMRVCLENAQQVELWNPETGEQKRLNGNEAEFCIPPNRTRYLVVK